MIAPTTTTAIPTASEIRAPSLKRANTSRPIESVPIGCARDGGKSDEPTSTAVAFFVQISGPKIARKTSRPSAATAVARAGS
jgi:hypothetical protein